MNYPRLSVLLVINSRDSIAGIERAFSEHDYASTLDIVHTVAEARGRISDQLPDIVLTLDTLTDGKGLALLGAQFYPLVLLVDADHRETLEEVLQAGYADYLVCSESNIASLPKLLLLQRKLWLQNNRIGKAERLAGLGFWEWDERSHRMASFSKGYASIMDMTRAEADAELSTAEDDLRYVHPEDRERLVETEAAAISRGEGVDVEYRVITKTGRARHIREVGEPVFDESGARVSCSGTIQDITDQKLLQQQFATSLADSKLVARLGKLGTYEWDWVEDKLVACSEEYARIAEMTVEEALQTFNSCEADYSFVHPDDLKRFAKIESDAMANGKGYSANYRSITPSGRVRHLREVAEVELNERGEVIRTVGSVQDVSEQALLEEQLHQAQKLEAVGRLAGGIAHDFNNLLTAISGYSALLLEDVKIDNPAYSDLNEIKNAAEQATELTRQLLAFSRKQILQPEVIDIGAIVGRMENMLRRLLQENVALVVDCEPNLHRVMADPGQIERVIVNLLVNARDAMPQGGKIAVAIENFTHNGSNDPALVDLADGEYVMLTVSDTGVGMTEEALSHIFEPFYTTKEVDKGTGLGLSTVFGIVKQSGGSIDVKSELRRGSTFRIYLPQVEACNLAVEPQEHRSSLFAGDETIMLVEDEELVRQLLKRTLEKYGYTVLLASQGAEAILAADKHESGIDLMITDVVMPHMSGHELAERLSAIRPEMKVLYISGHSEEMVANQGLVHREVRFLQKPFLPEDIATKVREILDAPGLSTMPDRSLDNRVLN